MHANIKLENTKDMRETELRMKEEARRARIAAYSKKRETIRIRKDENLANKCIS